MPPVMDSFRLVPSHPTAGEESFPVNSNDAVPKGKKLIRCDLCGRTVNSESQAEAHFKGLYHLSRMQVQGLPLPPDADLEKLRLYNAKVMKAMKSPLRQFIAGPNFYSRRDPSTMFDVRMPGIGMPVTSMPPPAGIPPMATMPPQNIVNSYTMNPSYDQSAHGRQVMCEICGVVTNSQTQAQSHLNGQKHLTRMAELGMQVPQDVAIDFLEASSMRHNKINYESVPKMQHHRFAFRFPQQFPQYQYSQTHGPRVLNYRSAGAAANAPFHNGQSFGPSGSNYPMRMRSVIPCETCQSLFNSQEQAQAHFNGSKHQKRLRMINFYRRNVEKSQGVPVRQIICPLCSTSVNSNKQMEAHVQGKLHKSKLEQMTTASEEAKGDQTPAKDSETNGDKMEQDATAAECTTLSSLAYDAVHCVPGSSSLNSNLYYQQHFTESELNENAEVDATTTTSKAKQTI